MSYEIVHLPRAQADLDEILTWLHERSPSGAATWFSRWLYVGDPLHWRYSSARNYARQPALIDVITDWM
jgi:plasmid stabilization system protein ParE